MGGREVGVAQLSIDGSRSFKESVSEASEALASHEVVGFGGTRIALSEVFERV